MREYKVYTLCAALFLGVFLNSCDGFLDITPVGQVIPENSTEYRGFINSAYKLVPSHKALLNMRGTHFNPEGDPWGMGLDGFDMFKDIYMWNDVNPDDKTQEYPYISFYQVIFYTNEIINNAPNAVDDNKESLKQIIGEAYALRAYMYFELANMYAPIYDKSTASSVKAIPISTKIDVEQAYPKATLQEVYDLILSDINNAQSYLEVSQQEGENRYRFSLEGLHALKSRVYLYMKEWQKSLDASTQALAISKALEDMNSDEYVPNTDYKSKEAILSLEYPSRLELTSYASISEILISSYKDGDLRPKHYFTESFSGYLVTNKVASKNEKVTFRRSELFLNAAESYARLGKDAVARTYLGELLKNRYTPKAYALQIEKLNTLSGDALVNEILLEREKELALEGHQWYDWRRTTQPEVRKTVKGVECVLKKSDPRYTLQIPKSAREANPLLNE